MEILFKGLTLQIEVQSYTPYRPAPSAQTPDSPGYSDPGDQEELEFVITGVEIDCKETLIDALRNDDDEGIGDLIVQEINSD